MASNNISVARWSLSATASDPANKTLWIGPQSRETSLDDDTRTVVNPADIAPGGKYYSIVKLQIKYQGQRNDDPRYAMGTGWLIAPDLLVTAGHCAFDHQYGFGRATEVKAYVGYNGKESIGKPGVQFRHGKAIATTKNWINDAVNRANDVSFIQMESAFQNIVPIVWDVTPTQGDLTLGVVGYPADQHDAQNEKGAQMYEMWADTHIDLRSTPSNMLEYKISTFAGQSGSPVLVKGKPTLTSIAAHVYGLGDRNSASTIRGQFGNDYGAYIKTFTANNYPTIATVAGVTYLDVPPQAGGVESDMEEGFWDVLTKVAKVGSTVVPAVLQAGTPFLGPQGAKIAASVGAALSIANQLVQPKKPGAESEFEPQEDFKSHTARAVLAEGALQTVLHMDAHKATKYRVFERMQKTFDDNKDRMGVVAKKIGPALLEPALRIAIADTAPKTGTESSLTQWPGIGDSTAPLDIQDRQQSRFVEGLVKRGTARGDVEGFFDFIKPFSSIAIKVAGAAVSTLVSGGESSMDDSPAPNDSLQAHMETMCHRALMGEAALQALIAVPVEQREEGFFDSIISVVKTVAPVVLKVAPTVVKAVVPIVGSILGGGESALDGETIEDILKAGKTLDQVLDPTGPGKNVVSKPSVKDLAQRGKLQAAVMSNGHVASDANGVSNGGSAFQELQRDGLFFAS